MLLWVIRNYQIKHVDDIKKKYALYVVFVFKAFNQFHCIYLIVFSFIHLVNYPQSLMRPILKHEIKAKYISQITHILFQFASQKNIKPLFFYVVFYFIFFRPISLKEYISIPPKWNMITFMIFFIKTITNTSKWNVNNYSLHINMNKYHYKINNGFI